MRRSYPLRPAHTALRAGGRPKRRSGRITAPSRSCGACRSDRLRLAGIGALAVGGHALRGAVVDEHRVLVVGRVDLDHADVAVELALGEPELAPHALGAR
jgi:hypothetical protein